MKDYDELWNQYALEFNDKLENKNNGDWEKLDEIEQEIAALWKLAADMYSAGFDDFFLRWGYDCYSYAMRGIKRIATENSGLKKTDCNNVYKLFEEAYTKVFARFENDDRIKSYEDIIEYLTEEDEEILEKTYEIFDEKLGPLLCTRAYEFYCENLKKEVI
ncbi:MAG: DMP19 family protein [Lachnospiraceae bacterium]|nr:DMP19 family protein [Lachnospiraceae bacterium]